MRDVIRRLIYFGFRSSLQDVTGIEHVPQQGPYLLAPNHVDWLDGGYVIAALYPYRSDVIHFLAETNNYWWTGFALPVVREHKGVTVDEAVRYLKAGAVICNFPEGRRNATDQLLPGKSGTVRMALMANVPIVPVGIRGPSRRTFLDSWRLWLTEKKSFTISFGEPLAWPEQAGRFDDQELVQGLTDELMRKIGVLCQKQP